jgi:DNA-binding transcriptional ArsR family regulator
MDDTGAIAALGALAQTTRLQLYRLLVSLGPTGLSAGNIAERLGIVPSSLSFHLQNLVQAGLVVQRRVGRLMIYSAEYATLRELVAFLTDTCTAGAVD